MSFKGAKAEGIGAGSSSSAKTCPRQADLGENPTDMCAFSGVQGRITGKHLVLMQLKASSKRKNTLLLLGSVQKNMFLADPKMKKTKLLRMVQKLLGREKILVTTAKPKKRPQNSKFV